jgi:hypothetical protein
MFLNVLAEASTPSLPDLPALGSAGLMGAMWLWERRTSRQRDQQLDEAHQRIMGDRVQLDQLVSLVRQNIEAITTLAATQARLIGRLEKEEKR